MALKTTRMISVALILFAAFFKALEGAELLDEWLQKQMSDYSETKNAAAYGQDLGYATPGHAEDDEDYMTAFFANHNHDAFIEDAAKSQGRKGDPQIDKHLANFFGIVRTETDEPLEDEEEEGGESEAFLANQADYIINEQDDEMYPQNHLENDLEMWFQTMNEGNDYENEEEAEEEEEEEEEGETGRTSDKLNVNFMDDFPDYAEVEAVLEMVDESSECGQWKEKVKRGHMMMRNRGKSLERKLREYKKALDDYDDENAVPCERKCDMKCVPIISGYKCVERVNGTCTEKTEIFDECGIEVRDPECEAEEADCEAKMKPVAEELQRAKKELDKAKKDMDGETRRLEIDLEGVPDYCSQPQ